MTKHALMTRRDFLKGVAVLGASLLYPAPLTATDAAANEFAVGANYPWIAYSHDFGNNGWGHDGLINNGWTYQTWKDSRGFVDTRRWPGKPQKGVASLRILADLAGKPANPDTNPKQAGEVYVNLKDHRPPNASVPLNLKGITIRCLLWLPKGSAGPSNARNGIQLFCKSEDSTGNWLSWYSHWENINPAWEGRWVQFKANLSDTDAFQDPLFDPGKVVAVGMKFAINGKSSAVLKGPIYLDNFVIETDPPVVFNFDMFEVDRDFKSLQSVLAQCPTRVVRVFVFGDGRAAPDFKGNGEVKGLDKDFFRDFDILLQVAKQRRLKLIPVLLDFHWCDKPKRINGVLCGGHSNVIRDAKKRQTFLNLTLKPFLERYGDHPSIYAIDVINEPEWAMKEVGYGEVPAINAVSIQEMQNFVRACGKMIHQKSSHKVTVGSARRKWLHYWQGLGLDLYQFHWYDHFFDEEPFPWEPYADLNLDKPCIIGEVPAKSTKFTTADYLNAAKDGGYSGLLVWSYRAGDDYSDFPAAKPALKHWCGASGQGCFCSPWEAG